MLFLVSLLFESKRQHGPSIENMLQRGSIRRAMEIEGGMTVARDESLPRVVAEAKLAKASVAAGKYFMRE